MTSIFSGETHLETLIPVVLSIIIVSIVATIPHIVSTNLKVNFTVVSVIRASLFFIIISGVLTGQNPENFQVHLLDELNFEFSTTGVVETKIISGKEMDMFSKMFRHL